MTKELKGLNVQVSVSSMRTRTRWDDRAPQEVDVILDGPHDTKITLPRWPAEFATQVFAFGKRFQLKLEPVDE